MSHKFLALSIAISMMLPFTVITSDAQGDEIGWGDSVPAETDQFETSTIGSFSGRDPNMGPYLMGIANPGPQGPINRRSPSAVDLTPPTLDTIESIQEIYTAYYGRPVDKEGLDYWANELNPNTEGFLSSTIDYSGRVDTGDTKTFADQVSPTEGGRPEVGIAFSEDLSAFTSAPFADPLDLDVALAGLTVPEGVQTRFDTASDVGGETIDLPGVNIVTTPVGDVFQMGSTESRIYLLIPGFESLVDTGFATRGEPAPNFELARNQVPGQSQLVGWWDQAPGRLITQQATWDNPFPGPNRFGETMTSTGPLVRRVHTGAQVTFVTLLTEIRRAGLGGDINISLLPQPLQVDFMNVQATVFFGITRDENDREVLVYTIVKVASGESFRFGINEEPSNIQANLAQLEAALNIVRGIGFQRKILAPGDLFSNETTITQSLQILVEKGGFLFLSGDLSKDATSDVKVSGQVSSVP